MCIRRSKSNRNFHHALKVKLSRFFEWSGGGRVLRDSGHFYVSFTHPSKLWKLHLLRLNLPQMIQQSSRIWVLVAAHKIYCRNWKLYRKKNRWWMLFAPFFKTARFASTWHEGFQDRDNFLIETESINFVVLTKRKYMTVFLQCISKLCLPQGS